MDYVSSPARPQLVDPAATSSPFQRRRRYVVSSVRPSICATNAWSNAVIFSRTMLGVMMSCKMQRVTPPAEIVGDFPPPLRIRLDAARPSLEQRPPARRPLIASLTTAGTHTLHAVPRRE